MHSGDFSSVESQELLSTYWNTVKSFNRDVRIFLLTALIIGFTVFGGIYSLLLNLYLLRLGYGPEFVGALNATGLLALAFLALPAGSLGGRWGVRRAMIVGLSICTAGFGLLPFAEWIPISLRGVWLISTFTIAHLGLTLYLVNSNPFLMAATQPHERNHVFSVQSALWPLAGFAGSLVGGVLPGIFAAGLGVSLDSPIPYRYPLIIAALLLFGTVWVVFVTREVEAVSHPGEVPQTGPMPFAIIALLALVGFLRVGGEGIARTFINVYMDDSLGIATAQIGTLFAIAQLLAVPAALFTPLLAARWGSARVLLWGTAAVALSLLPLAFILHWTAAAAGFISLIAFASVTRPVFIVYSQEAVERPWWSTMSGATTMTVGLSWGVSAFGGGYIITSVGYNGLFLAGALVTAAGALLFGIHSWRQRRLSVQPSR
jgi:MFS family permease